MLRYEDGEKRYILYPLNLTLNSKIVSDFNAPVSIGNAMPLSKVPLGAEVHNIEFRVRSEFKTKSRSIKV